MNPWQAWTQSGPESTTPAWNEATQLALLWGDEATALDGRWPELLRSLRHLGAVTTMVENEACALAVTGPLRSPPSGGRSLRLDGPQSRLSIARDRLGFAFATGTPRRKGLASGFTFHGVDGGRLVAMELDESEDLSAFREVAQAHRATHDIALPQGATPAAPRQRPPSLGPSFLQAWARVRTHADLDRMLDLLHISRIPAYQLLAAQGTTPLDAQAFLDALAAMFEGDTELVFAVGRDGVELRARSNPARLACNGPQLVLQGDELALAIDLRFVHQSWQVDIMGHSALELLDEDGDLLLRVGSPVLFDQAERPCWTRRAAR